MKRPSKYIEENGKLQTCKCGGQLFTVTRGHKRRNKTAKTWEEKAYYIEKCVDCGKREDSIIYDWRKVTRIPIYE